MANPTLDEFMQEVGPAAREQGIPDRELRRYWAQTYSEIHPSTLPTWEAFKPTILEQNPNIPEDAVRSYWEEQYGDLGAREKDQGDFVRGAKEAVQQIPQTMYGLEAGAGAVGEAVAGEGGLFTALKKHGLKRYQDYAADIAREAKPSDSITDAYEMAKAGEPGALVDWLQHALGYGGSQVLQMLATAGIGYAGGKLALQPAAAKIASGLVAREKVALVKAGATLTADELTKQAVSNVAARAGQTAALAAVATGMEGGEIYGGLVEKAAEEGRSLTGAELAQAFGATVAAGGTELIEDKIGLKLLFGRSLAGKLTSTRLGHAAAAGSLGLATGSGTEFTQTLLEEFGKGNDPFSPQSLKQAVDAAALGGFTTGAVGAVAGGIRRPEGQVPDPSVTERTPEDMGMGPPSVAPHPTPSPQQSTASPVSTPAQESAQTDLFAQPKQASMPKAPTATSPTEVVDPSPVLHAKDLDSAIAGSQQIVKDATDQARSRAEEFSRMAVPAREVQPPPTLSQPTVTVPALSIQTQPEQTADTQSGLAAERSRMDQLREQQRLQQQNPVSEPVAPVQAVEPADTPLPSQIDLAYPSSKQVRDLIHEKGLHLDTPVFRDYLKQAVGKEKFSDLTPQELQTLAEKVQKIKAPQQPAQIQEAPPQVPLTPAAEKPYAPVTTIPEAQVPRSELTPEKNAEILLRAEKAKADMEIAGTERGGRFFQDQPGTGSTQEVTGLKSATADWYKELTSGPSPAIRGDRKQSAREKIEVAIAKIIKDQGADRGKAVEQVKAALLQDTEFHKTEWGRDLNSILQGEWPSWIDKPEGVTQATENAQEFQNVPRGTHQVPLEVPKLKVPLSRKERLAQEKQKLEGKKQGAESLIDQALRSVGVDPNAPPDKAKALRREAERITKEAMKSLEGIPGGQPISSTTDRNRRDRAMEKMRTAADLIRQAEELEAKKAEPLPSEAPGMEPRLATASPERAPAPSTSEAAPTTEEPFSLSSPEVSKPKAKDQGPEQLSIDVPPPTSGSRPIIGREATLEEAPLFSKNAQTPDAEQTSLSEPLENPDESQVIPKQNSGSSAQSNTTAQSPTEIIADALRTAADKIEGKPPTEAIDTVEKYQAFRKRLLDGEVTLDEYKQAFQQTKDNKDALLAGLKKLNKDQLVKVSNSFHTRKSESKDRLIEQAYDGMLRGFALGRGVSYAMTGKGSYENAMAKLVEQTTADDLAKFAEEVSKNTAEYKARVQGFLDPKTLEDFDARVRIKGEASLTPEQLARYDELLAQAGREKRKQVQEQKATVQGVEAGTDLQLIESKHTKTGDKLWVVKLANRVERAVYDRLNQAAHKLGGRYSSYNKDGAIPGFTFRSEEAAKSFMAAGKGETVSAAPIQEAATIQVQNNAVAKLREMADSLQEKADDSLNADRKTNTAKRARQASSAENDALKDKALAETMRNLADAIESGEATHLSGLRTKAQVEMLDSMLERAKYDRIKQETKGSYVDYERQKDRKAEPEDVAFASYPELDGSKSELFSAYKDLATIKGADRLRNRFYKQAESVGEDQRVKLAREDVELAIEKYPRKSSIPWHWPETLAKLKRLESMGITSLPELRAALREFVEYRGKRGTIDKAKQLERELIGNKGVGNDFFPTPKETARRMVAEAGIEPDMTVLEPSAGNGNIAEVIRAAGVNPDVVEQSPRLREILEAKGFNLAGQDFMDVKEGGYDRIIMNPPFSNGQDAEHIHHAYTLLKPGGKLVAIAGEGIFFRNDAKATEFRQWLENVGGTSEQLPEGTFKDAALMATTGVNARMVVVEKPDEGPLPYMRLEELGERAKRDGGLLNVNPATPQFDERNAERAEPTMAQFAQAFSEGVAIAGTEQKLIDSSQEFPKEMIKALSAKRYVQQLTAELGKVFNAMKRVLVQSDPDTFSSVTFAALSPDSYYYGVNLHGQDQMILNPWTALHQVQQGVQEGFIGEEEVPEYLAGNLIKTLVHEFTHQQVTTTHQDERQPYFLAAEQRNRAILGSRLAMMQRQLMAVLTGGTNGTVEGIRADLTQQQAFWKKGDGLSAMDQSVSPEPSYARRRQGVSGEGASGRTGPPTYLRGGSESQTIPLDESAGLQRSRADLSETGTIDPPTAREKLNAAGRTLRPYLLGALGLEQLSQVYGNDHAEVKAYNKATQAMEADFTKMSRDSDKIARAWTDLKIPVAGKMAQVMDDARFLNFDPDPKKNQEMDSEKKQQLRERFAQLPGEAQAVYRLARDFYTTMFKDRLKAIEERVQRAGGAQTQKLLDEFSLEYNKALGHVYFPSTRFGDHVVFARKMEDGKEVDRDVKTFESVLEAQKFATRMKMKGWKVKQTVAKEFSQDKQNVASGMVKKLAAIIDTMDSSPSLPELGDWKAELLDHVNQTYLQSLPDLSYSKHSIHARNVKGASKDALRAFAHSALHGAHHISRIRHSDKLSKALEVLDERITKTDEDDVAEARQVYNELVKRHESIMNPNTHPFSAWLGQLGFTMSLGGVVATGITNATQVPLVTYPWLGARYGFGKASAALAKAYKDFLDPRTLNKDSLFDATAGLEKEIERLSKLPAKQKVEALKDEVKMLKELARRGRIDLTQTMDLAGLSSRDNLSRKARMLGTVGEKVTQMLGFTFHVPEVMNRQVTALATFRLERAKEGATFETALERAEQAILDTHFLYESWNRPRYMQGNFLRVLTMFKQYSQNIAYTYGRAAAIWLDKNGATKEERAVAKRQLASMLVLQFGAAGALGMPFFGTPISLIMTALGAMGDDDEEKDWEVALRKWLDGTATSLAEAFIDDKDKAREVGKEMAEVVSHGASRLTPWDMAGRLGQNDLFVREPQREREGRAAVFDWMMALGGPVPSYGVNTLLGLGDVWKGMTELNGGFFMRGVEELTPAVLRNGVKSLRYTLEGVRTRDEYKQLELSTSEELGQVFGFTPARVAEMYESTTAIKNKEHRILNQQKALKDRFARAVDDQDNNAKQRILEDIRGFNERNPIFAITSDTLNRSLKARRQHEAGMERGMYLPPRRRALLEEGDWADF